MRILLVEDEQQLREQLTRSLSDAGYAVDTAADGEEAIFMGREYPYDLAVIDLGLPKVDGIEVVTTLRKLERDFSGVDSHRTRSLAG